MSNGANLRSTESDLKRTSLSLMQWNIEAPMSARRFPPSPRDPSPSFLTFFNLFLRKSSPVPGGLESKDRDPPSFLLLPLDQRKPPSQDEPPSLFSFSFAAKNKGNKNLLARKNSHFSLDVSLEPFEARIEDPYAGNGDDRSMSHSHGYGLRTFQVNSRTNKVLDQHTSSGFDDLQAFCIMIACSGKAATLTLKTAPVLGNFQPLSNEAFSLNQRKNLTHA
ncbi:hypothetical protein VNO77_23005 [Canavalia gladiata]|uniref:Uncharacterized protein n=1 Tax=Canavalia gladiata TaxID=3824 RepID=A0AAN9L4J3_CANGL